MSICGSCCEIWRFDARSPVPCWLRLSLCSPPSSPYILHDSPDRDGHTIENCELRKLSLVSSLSISSRDTSRVFSINTTHLYCTCALTPTEWRLLPTSSSTAGLVVVGSLSPTPASGRTRWPLARWAPPPRARQCRGSSRWLVQRRRRWRRTRRRGRAFRGPSAGRGGRGIWP